MPDVFEWNVRDDVTDGSDEMDGRPSLEGADMIWPDRSVGGINCSAEGVAWRVLARDAGDGDGNGGQWAAVLVVSWDLAAELPKFRTCVMRKS